MYPTLCLYMVVSSIIWLIYFKWHPVKMDTWLLLWPTLHAYSIYPNTPHLYPYITYIHTSYRDSPYSWAGPPSPYRFTSTSHDYEVTILHDLFRCTHIFVISTSDARHSKYLIFAHLWQSQQYIHYHANRRSTIKARAVQYCTTTFGYIT